MWSSGAEPSAAHLTKSGIPPHCRTSIVIDIYVPQIYDSPRLLHKKCCVRVESQRNRNISPSGGVAVPEFRIYLLQQIDRVQRRVVSRPCRDALAAARARRRPRAEPSTGVVEGPQGGEAREGSASGARSRRERVGDSCGSQQLWRVN